MFDPSVCSVCSTYAPVKQFLRVDKDKVRPLREINFGDFDALTGKTHTE